MNRKQQSAKEPRKPVKATDRGLIPQKRVESAQESKRSRQQKSNEKPTESQILRERLNAIVLDYLHRGNYTRTIDTFEQESSLFGEQDQMTVATKVLLQNFDSGQREMFHANWERYTPQSVRESDHNTWKLEFYLQIYFLIYPIHPTTIKRTRSAGAIDKDSVSAFKAFLDTRGFDLSKTNEVLPFYALPYVKSPQNHPSFQHLFTVDWVNQLRARLSAFLQEIHGGEPHESQLQHLYLQAQKDHSDSEVHEYAERLALINKQLQNENNELKGRLSSQSKAYQELNDNAQTNIYDSQQKWFQFTRNLALLSKDLIKMIDHSLINDIPFSEQRLDNLRKKLSQYEKFLNSNIDDLMSQSQDISLFEKASVMDQEQSNILPYNPNLIHQQSQTNLQQQYTDEQLNQDLIALDYSKIINLFTTSTNYVQICNVLQALRWRISRSSNPYERRSVVVAYATHDILGTHQRNIQLAQYLTLKSHPKVQEFTLKIINSLASDYSGRSYLTQSSYLVKFLIETVKREKNDTIKRKNAIGALQKLSLRQQAQLWMIEHNLIHTILLILKNEKESLSEYCYEYITAMLMNLSLRSAGKDKIEGDKELVFEVLFSLIECINEQIRTFINGTLYSLLSRRTFRDYANQLNLGDILQNLYDDSDERFKKQIMYMIHQLKMDKQQDNEDVEDSLSEQVEENDVDDIDDEDQCMFEDEDEEDQILELNENMIVGEELLSREFALKGPEAEKVYQLNINYYQQKLITDSIVLKELQQRSGYHNNNRQQQSHHDDVIESYQEQQQHVHKPQTPHQIDIHKPSYPPLPRNKLEVPQKKIMSHQQQQQQHAEEPVAQPSYAFQSRPKIPRTPPVFQEHK